MRYFRVVDKVHFIQEVSHFLNYVIPAVIESKKKQYTMIYILLFLHLYVHACVYSCFHLTGIARNTHLLCVSRLSAWCLVGFVSLDCFVKEPTVRNHL